MLTGQVTCESMFAKSIPGPNGSESAFGLFCGVVIWLCITLTSTNTLQTAILLWFNVHAEHISPLGTIFVFICCVLCLFRLRCLHMDTTTVIKRQTTPKTKLVDLGETLFTDVKDLADQAGMGVSTVARLLIKHALSQGGSIGYVPHVVPDFAASQALRGSNSSHISNGPSVLR